MLEDALKKVMGIDVAKTITSGDLSEDWLPKEYATEFIDLIREKNWCRQLFKTVNMPGPVFDIPKLSADSTVYYVSSEVTAPGAQSEPTFAAAGTVRLTAKKLMAYVEVSNEVDEDSKIAMLPLVKNNFAESMAAAEEKAMIQGDTVLGFGATDPRAAFNGLVKLAGVSYASVKVGGVDVWKTIVQQARYKLGVYGRDVRNLVLMVNPYSAAIVRILDEVITVDKYGTNATILTGEIGKYLGIPVIEHPYVPEDNTDAASYDTPSHADKGVALLLRADSPLIGDRRKIKFDTDKDVTKDCSIVAISERIGFCCQYTEAICKITGLDNSIG